MEIYLVRHTEPAIEKGICYGQADIEIKADEFRMSVSGISDQLPDDIDIIYSSPLKRCSHLAEHIQSLQYSLLQVRLDPRLKELHFGDWELKAWDEINQADLQPWMEDFVNKRTPNGESNMDLHVRALSFLDDLPESANKIAVFTHAGVIRSILTAVNGTALAEAFSLYSVGYGEVIVVRYEE